MLTPAAWSTEWVLNRHVRRLSHNVSGCCAREVIRKKKIKLRSRATPGGGYDG